MNECKKRPFYTNKRFGGMCEQNVDRCAECINQHIKSRKEARITSNDDFNIQTLKTVLEEEINRNAEEYEDINNACRSWLERIK